MAIDLGKECKIKYFIHFNKTNLKPIIHVFNKESLKSFKKSLITWICLISYLYSTSALPHSSKSSRYTLFQAFHYFWHRFPCISLLYYVMTRVSSWSKLLAKAFSLILECSRFMQSEPKLGNGSEISLSYFGAQN